MNHKKIEIFCSWSLEMSEISIWKALHCSGTICSDTLVLVQLEPQINKFNMASQAVIETSICTSNFYSKLLVEIRTPEVELLIKNININPRPFVRNFAYALSDLMKMTHHVKLIVTKKRGVKIFSNKNRRKLVFLIEILLIASGPKIKGRGWFFRK